VIDTLQAWDEALLMLLNGSPESFSAAGWWLSQPWSSTPVYLFVIWRIFKGVTWQKGALRLVLVLLTFAGTDAISSRLFKPGFERLRPSHNPALEDTLILHENADGTVYRGGRFGFVSSHAANTFGLAGIAFLILGGSATLWLFVWAAAVSWTRMYLGVHYPADIVSFLILGGSATLWLFVWAAAVSWTRMYLGVHYPADIVFGAVFGIGLAKATHTLFYRIFKAQLNA